MLPYPLNSTLQLGLLASTPLTQFPLPRPCALSPAAAPKPFESSTNKMLLSCIVSVHSKSFQINTCKTGSKQTSLTAFRINTSWGRTHFAQFWCNVTPFRINTSKSVSKQTTLTSFRMNTYEKTAGWGVPPLTETSTIPRTPTTPFSYLIKAPCAAA